MVNKDYLRQHDRITLWMLVTVLFTWPQECQKWKLIDKRRPYNCRTSCSHPIPAVSDNRTCGADSGYTAPVSLHSISSFFYRLRGWVGPTTFHATFCDAAATTVHCEQQRKYNTHIYSSITFSSRHPQSNATHSSTARYKKNTRRPRILPTTGLCNATRSFSGNFSLYDAGLKQMCCPFTCARVHLHVSRGLKCFHCVYLLNGRNKLVFDFWRQSYGDLGDQICDAPVRATTHQRLLRFECHGVISIRPTPTL